MKHYAIVTLLLLSSLVRGQTIDPGLKISNGLKNLGSAYRLYPRADSLKLAAISPGGSGVSSYTALTDTPIIPTNTSQLANGAGYQTAAQTRTIVSDSVRVFAPGANVTFSTSGNTTTINSNGGSVTVDNVPTNGSVNPISSDAVFDSLTTARTRSTTNTNTIATNTATIASLSATVAALQSAVAALSGTFTIATPTLSASVLSGTSIALSWPASTSATSYAIQQGTSSAFSSPVSLTTTSATSFTVTGLTVGTTYWFRVQASGGAGTTSSGYGSVSAVTANSYAVRETLRLAMQTSTTGSTTGLTNWNRLLPTSAQVTTGGSYTLASLITDTGASTTYAASLNDPFTSATASSMTATSGSVYPDAVLARAYLVSAANTTGGSIVLHNLNPADFVQVYVYGASTNTTSVRYTVSGLASSNQTKAVANNAGVAGGSEFAPNTALVYFANVQPAANGTITVRTNNSSGAASPLNAVALTFSTVAKP